MNIFNIPEGEIKKEIFDSLLQAQNVKIERIISKGHKSALGFWYEQNENEWVVVLQGESELEFESEKIYLKKGDHLLIQKGVKHRVSYTSDEPCCIWLAIFFNE